MTAGSRIPIPRRSRAVATMLLAALFFSIMGALIKHLAVTLPLAQIVLFRMVVSLVLILPVLVRQGRAGFATKRLGQHFFRTFIGTLSLAGFAYSVRELLLADASAITYSTPLWAVILAALFYGEKVGVRRGLATLVGFTGVLIIVRPQGDLNPAMLVALGTALLNAMIALQVKDLARTEPSSRMTFYFTLFGALFAAIPAAIVWQPPTLEEYALLLGTGVAGVFGIYFMNTAYGMAEATVIAPVEFTRLPIAAAIGWMAFAEIPDVWSGLGALIVGIAIIDITYQRPKPDKRNTATQSTDQTPR